MANAGTTPRQSADADREREAACSSTELVRRMCRGDRSAADALLARHLPGLYRWASGRLPRAARDRGDTADLVQESLLRVFRRLPSFEPRHRDALRAYLRQAIANRLRSEHRRVVRAPHVGPLTDDLPDAGTPSPLDEAIGEETRRRYGAAIHRLHPEDQRAIVARVDLGYTYEQIALVLGRSTPDAARVAVSRALVRLAQEMERSSARS